ISHDDVCTGAGKLSSDAHRLDGRVLGGSSRANIEVVTLGPLSVSRGQVLKQGHPVNQLEAELGEVACQPLTSGHHHDLLLWVQQEVPKDKCYRNPTLANPSESLEDGTVRAVL